MKKHSKSLLEILRPQFGQLTEIRGAEIGVWRGHNAAELLQAFPQLFLYCVDRYQPLSRREAKADFRMAVFPQEDFDNAKEEALKLTDFAIGRHEFWIMDSVEASRRMLDETLDFVFLDGCHDYENVKTDLDAWTLKLRNGGIFCGHDYGGQGDRRGRFGVKRAVDEWALLREATISRAPGNIWWTQV